MAYTVPYDEPAVFAAGDRVQWKKRGGQFPPGDGWTLTYYPKSNLPTGLVTPFAATDSGNDYVIDITPTMSLEYTPTTYYYQSYVAKTDDRKLFSQGKILVTTNLETLEVPQDFRSHARRCLDSINLLLEGRATADIQRYVFQAVGRSVDKIPIADLLKFRDYYLTEVQAEEAAAAGGKNRNVFVSFNM